MGFIMIGDAVYPIDTDEQEALARNELFEAGIKSAPIWHGDPGCPDAYQDREFLLFAREAVNR